MEKDHSHASPEQVERVEEHPTIQESTTMLHNNSDDDNHTGIPVHIRQQMEHLSKENDKTQLQLEQFQAHSDSLVRQLEESEDVKSILQERVGLLEKELATEKEARSAQTTDSDSLVSNLRQQLQDSRRAIMKLQEDAIQSNRRRQASEAEKLKRSSLIGTADPTIANNNLSGDTTNSGNKRPSPSLRASRRASSFLGMFQHNDEAQSPSTDEDASAHRQLAQLSLVSGKSTEPSGTNAETLQSSTLSSTTATAKKRSSAAIGLGFGISGSNSPHETTPVMGSSSVMSSSSPLLNTPNSQSNTPNLGSSINEKHNTLSPAYRRSISPSPSEFENRAASPQVSLNLTKELETLKQELAQTKTQLRDAEDSKSASETCLKALRELIENGHFVQSESAGTDQDNLTRAQLAKIQLPKLPTDPDSPVAARSDDKPAKTGRWSMLWGATKKDDHQAGDGASAAASPLTPAESKDESKSKPLTDSSLPNSGSTSAFGFSLSSLISSRKGEGRGGDKIEDKAENDGNKLENVEEVADETYGRPTTPGQLGPSALPEVPSKGEFTVQQQSPTLPARSEDQSSRPQSSILSMSNEDAIENPTDDDKEALEKKPEVKD